MRREQHITHLIGDKVLCQVAIPEEALIDLRGGHMGSA